jgi:hypothetical protein
VEQWVVAYITPNLADRDVCVSNAGDLFRLRSQSAASCFEKMIERFDDRGRFSRPCT